ncbi:MAG: dihydrofolate reductase [Sphingobacteriales bacterium]|nr:MAG: dihydrofolate reductase [Sphingobacteriales bacterium]
MRKLILYIAASLDGKIAGSDHSLDWLPDPSTDDYGYQELMDTIDTVVMGYKTYKICMGLGWTYHGKQAYIFSRSEGKSVIPEAKLITDDPSSFIDKLKREDGKDIWLIGGGEMVRILHDAGLIDEYILTTIPIILGDGIELFPRIKAKLPLHLIKHKAYDNGLTMAYYKQRI